MYDFLIYRNYQRAILMLEENRVNQFTGQYDICDLEGFKLMFLEEEKQTEPESDKPF